MNQFPSIICQERVTSTKQESFIWCIRTKCNTALEYLTALISSGLGWSKSVTDRLGLQSWSTQTKQGIVLASWTPEKPLEELDVTLKFGSTLFVPYPIWYLLKFPLIVPHCSATHNKKAICKNMKLFMWVLYVHIYVFIYIFVC